MSLAKYSFIPWMRQGIAASIAQTDNPSNTTELERATIPVRLKVKNSTGAIATLPDKNIKIVGPGDVVKINTNNVVKVYPEPNSPDMEPNYLPFIEFYQDTFCWDYTPASAASTNNERLRPWLFLAVLEDDVEYTYQAETGSMGPSIELIGSHANLLPDPTKIWAWAHVHVNTDLTSTNLAGARDLLQSKLDANPDFAVCRLLSPRDLAPDKNYTAFVIPAFETGRLAGLGLDPSTIAAQKSSWATGGSNGKFPVYYKWSFKTGVEGDFESLLRKLTPQEFDGNTFYRAMDIQEDSPYGVNGVTNPSTVSLGGALQATNFPTLTWDESEHATTRDAYELEMATLLNLGEDMKYSSSITWPPVQFIQNDDPVVTPPLYGRWHALVRTIETSIAPGFEANTWVRNLNVDPRNRAAAGVGADIVQKYQEEYMEQAWEQVGDLLTVNQMLYRAQFGIEIAARLVEKHLAPRTSGDMLSLAAYLLRRFGNCFGPGTLFSEIQNSCFPVAAFSPTFRRLFKGPLRRAFGAGSLESLLIALNSNSEVAAAGPYSFPSGKVPGSNAVSYAIVAQIGMGSYNSETGDAFYISAPGEENEEEDPYGWADYKSVLEALFGQQTFLEDEDPCAFPDFDAMRNCLMGGLNPRNTIRDRVLSKIAGSNAVDVVGIMDEPDFHEPVYYKLKERSLDFILPNLNKIPRNSIGLLETNQKFIESFMIGMNHEMGRELLWNEYPTDQRGSYFRQFWDVSSYIDKDGVMTTSQLAESLKDIPKIHTWPSNTDMGDHNNRATSGGNTLVLAIRGELLERYPGTMVYAQRGEWFGGERRPKSPEEVKYPIFKAVIDPDITFLGFDITDAQAIGNATDGGWYFIFKELPGGPRFGLDETMPSPIPNPGTWNDLAWPNVTKDTSGSLDPTGSLTSFYAPSNDADLNNIGWGQNSADVAYILYQLPFRMAIHATEMIPTTI